jgi:hemoglobin-like flavoprotein
MAALTRQRMLQRMTPKQKNLVQDSFSLVVPIADEAGALFYSRLFQVDPTLRTLFRGDLSQQSRKLMQMLAVAVRGLDNLESIVPAVHALGRRHVAYGVTSEQFEAVGAALLWTLATALGPGFTSEVREAWTAVYSVVANTMQEGMRQAEESTPALAA